jgi:hypothetical protein
MGLCRTKGGKQQTATYQTTKKSPPMRTRNIYEAKYSPISALRLRSLAIASRSI